MHAVLGLCVVVAIGFGTLARASQQAATEKYLVYGAGSYGAGTYPCDSWLAARKENCLMTGERFTWVQGFVSGAGWRGYKTKGASAEQMLVWLDQYCAAHPSDHLSAAAAALVETFKAN